MSVTTVSLRTVALVDLLKVRCVRGKANRSNLIIELMQPTSPGVLVLESGSFIKWRQENDLPFLLEFFKNELPNSATG